MNTPNEPAADAAPPAQRSASAWSPFHYATFAMLWVATVVSPRRGDGVA